MPQRDLIAKGVLWAGLAAQAYLLGANYDGLRLLLVQLIFSFWIVGPFALFYWLTRKRGTDEQVALSGILLLTLHAFFLSVYYKSTSSTTAIMFLFTPVYELIPLSVLFLPPGRKPLFSVLACIVVGIGAVHGVTKLTKEAADPATPPARLQHIADGGWGWLKGVKQALAGNPSTPPALLETLAVQGDEYLLRDLGNNPSAPPPLLAKIVEKHKGFTALWGVARNPNTPVDSLKILSERTQEDAGGKFEWELYQAYVITGLAANPAAPCGFLKNLPRSGPGSGLPPRCR